jgi:hypothetical protein
MDLTGKRRDLERDGYIAIADLLTEHEVAWYLECYDKILSGKIDAGQWRSDLGSGQSRKREGVENITQVMWPSELIPDLHYSRGNNTAGHRRALIINFRPKAMIRLEREQGFDHGKTKNVRENRR